VHRARTRPTGGPLACRSVGTYPAGVIRQAGLVQGGAATPYLRCLGSRSLQAFRELDRAVHHVIAATSAPPRHSEKLVPHARSWL